jgi:hypothetical protein
VQDFATNGSGISDTSGWVAGGKWDDKKGATDYGDMSLVGMPDLRDIPASQWDNLENYLSFLRYKQENATQVLYNSGFADHRSAIN